MAKMGRRKIRRAKVLSNPTNNSFMGIGYMHINLTINPIQIQTISAQGIELPTFGVPIMREGFITGTGLLIGS